MRRGMRGSRIAVLLMLLSLVLAMAAPGVSANVSGAIWTTTGSCTNVNGNNYADKADVYLNGGPAGNAGSGLPDGEYYFQVTDPSGSVLLSTDAIEDRRATVTNGRFSSTSGPHATVSCGPDRVAIQLIPFADTPNGGGVYKVWITHVDSYDGNEGTFGFINSESKTDNFRVQGDIVIPQSEVLVVKYYDADPDGAAYDGSQDLIDGWRMTLTDVLTAGTATRVTGSYASGTVQFTGLVNGDDYTVTELPMPVVTNVPGGVWVASPVNVDPVAFTAAGSNETIYFGNRCEIQGQGRTIGYWSNKNGQSRITSANLNDLNDFTDNWHQVNGKPDFGTQNELKNYLLGATATQMEYMLSAQMMATWLNITVGPTPQLPGGAYVSTPDGTMTISDALAFAASGVLPSGDRAWQEAWKNLFDAINNNAVPVVAGPDACNIVYP